jgi:hypothetical protein
MNDKIRQALDALDALCVELEAEEVWWAAAKLGIIEGILRQELADGESWIATATEKL